MEKRRLFSILCGVIAAMLVIMAGKSCTDDALKQKKKGQTTTSPTSDGYEIIFPSGDISPVPQDTKPVETDIFGNVIETTEPEYLTIVDAEGNIIGTIPNDPDYIAGFTTPTETTSTSLLDQYYADLENPNQYGGFYHGDKVTTTANAVTTVPETGSTYVFDPNDLAIDLG